MDIPRKATIARLEAPKTQKGGRSISAKAEQNIFDIRPTSQNTGVLCINRATSTNIQSILKHLKHITNGTRIKKFRLATDINKQQESVFIAELTFIMFLFMMEMPGQFVSYLETQRHSFP